MIVARVSGSTAWKLLKNTNDIHSLSCSLKRILSYEGKYVLDVYEQFVRATAGERSIYLF